MAETSKPQQLTGNYRAKELLARASETRLVGQKLSELELGTVEDAKPDAVGLVRFTWEADRDAGAVVDLVKKGWGDWDWVPSVSPNHILGTVVDPHTAQAVKLPVPPIQGQSEDIGGPAKAPKPTDLSFEARTASDVAGTGVTIGVLDSGITQHPWLAGSYLATPGDFDPQSEADPAKLDPQEAHGTFVAGIILQQAPGATVRAVRVLDANGEADILEVAEGIAKLAALGVDIINLSLGGYSRRGQHMKAFDPVLAALPHDTVVVAAAGNHHDVKNKMFRPSRKHYPAAIDEVVSVACLGPESDREPGLAPFSNFGPWVSVSTYGMDVVSTFVRFRNGKVRFNGWAKWSGTSFAAPRVAGAIAARMTENGRRVRSAQEAKELLLQEAEGEPFGTKRVALDADPGPGRFLRLPPRIAVS